MLFKPATKKRALRRSSARFEFDRLEDRTLLAADLGLSPVADFSLVDANTTSETYGEEVSPRDYLGEVSAWYFGHST